MPYSILDTFVPSTPFFPVADANAVAGGMHSYSTLASRNSLDSSRKKAGMLCYVAETGKRYKLADNLTTWTEDNASGTPRFVDLSQAGMSTSASGATNTAALQAAVDAALEGDTLYLPPGDYPVSDTTAVTISKNIVLSGIRGASRLVNANASSYAATLLYVLGVPNGSAVTTLTRNHFPGDMTVYIASTSGLSAGQWIVIRDSLSLMAWSSQDTLNQDIVRIESVGVGNVVIHRPLTRRYLTTRSAGLHLFTTNPPRVVISGIELVRGRIDMTYAVDSLIRDCKVQQCSWPGFAFFRSSGCLLQDCVTESPVDKTTSGSGGEAFFFHNSTLCQVRGHVARNVEGAVVRRGSRYITIESCRFEGANTGLATYSGDVRHCLVSDCVFVGSSLVWGAGGHFADQYNKSTDCEFVKPSTRAIGNAGTALAEVGITFDGRAIKADSEHGFDNGQAVVIYGTTTPTGMTASRRYFAIGTTYGAGTWGREFVLSDSPSRPPSTVTFDGTARTVDMGAGWSTGDAVVFHAAAAPGGADVNRLYFLLNQSGTAYYLQKRPAQTATFDASTDRVTLTGTAGSEWVDGDTISFVTAGTLPAELTAAPTVYFLRDGSAGTFKLATTLGGSAINLTTAGSGTIYAVAPCTSTTSSVVSAEGGTPLALSGSVSGAVVTTSGEGNIFEGHVIHDPPANVVHMHRVSGSVIRNLSFQGAQDATNGICCFTLSRNTDVTIEGCTARNGSVVANNRVAHLDNCFDVTIRGGEYDLQTTGQLFTGGGGVSNLRIEDTGFPAITTRSNLLYSGVVSTVSRLANVTLGSGYTIGSSVQTVGDASVALALPGTTANTLVFDTTLTAARTVDLDDYNAVKGDTVRVVRNASGAYTLTARKLSDSSTLHQFSTSETAGAVEFVWTGTDWKKTLIPAAGGGGAPSAHAASHAAAGSDPVTLTTAQITGLDSTLDARRFPEVPDLSGIVSGNVSTLTQLAWFGDSWGQGSSSIGYGYLDIIKRTLKASGMLAGYGYIPFSDSFLATGQTGISVSKTGTWTNSSNATTSRGPSPSHVSTTDSGATLTVTCDWVPTALRILFSKIVSGGTAQYRVNGGSWTTFSTGGTADSPGYVDVSGLPTTAPWTLDIGVSSVGSGIVLCGIDHQVGTTGVRIHKLAVSGASIKSYSEWATAYASNWRYQLANLGLETSVASNRLGAAILLGTNDRNDSTTSEYVTRMNTFLATFQGLASNAYYKAKTVVFIPPETDAGDGTSTTRVTAFYPAARGAVVQQNYYTGTTEAVPVINLNPAWGSPTPTQAREWCGGTGQYHPAQKGIGALGSAILQTMGGGAGNNLAQYSVDGLVDAVNNKSRFLLYDTATGTYRRVEFGAADSAGTGYRTLRTAN